MSTSQDSINQPVPPTSPVVAVPTLKQLRARRWAVIGGFLIATMILLAGFQYGPESPERGPFDLTEDPVFQADQRVGEHLAPEDHPVFMFVGGQDEDTLGNVLDIAVLREVTTRTDEVMADPDLSIYFKQRYNPLVGHNTTGPFNLPETVRDIMDGGSMVVPWTGPDFNTSTNAELGALLDILFEVNYTIGPGNQFFPYSAAISTDLHRMSDGTWSAVGMIIVAFGHLDWIDDAIDDGDLRNREAFEALVDGYYQEPFSSSLDVQVYSFAAINTQVEDQINATLPLVGISFLVMIGFIATFFRNWRDVLVATVGLILLFLWMNGTQAWLGFPVTQLSSMLPILLLALGVDFGIHSLQRWRRISQSDSVFGNRPEMAQLGAARPAIKTLFPALGLATITTMIAFGTATLSPIPDLREWGILAVISILEAYLLLGIFTVYLRSGFAAPAKKATSGSNALKKVTSSASKVFDRRSPVVLVGFLIFTGAMLAIGQPDANFDAKDYLDNDSRVVQALDMNKLTFPDSGEPSYFLIEGDQLADPEVLRDIDALVTTLPEIGATFDEGVPFPTISDFLRVHALMKMNPAAAAIGPDVIDQDGDLLPDTESNAVEVLDYIRHNGARDDPDPAAASRSYSPADVQSIYQMNDDGSRLERVRVWFNVQKAEDWQFLEDFLEDLEEISADVDSHDGVDVFITGPSYTRYAYVNAITDSFATSTFVAIGLCSIVLLLVLRDFRLAILAIIPVLMVSIWLQAIMVMADISLNVVTVQVISLSIGLGLDYSIHVTQRMREEKAENPNGTRREWLQATMQETGIALFASALTTLAGFLILLMAPMALFIMFGRIMAIMIGLSIVAALVALPALLMLFGRFRRGEGELQSPIPGMAAASTTV